MASVPHSLPARLREGQSPHSRHRRFSPTRMPTIVQLQPFIVAAAFMYINRIDPWTSTSSALRSNESRGRRQFGATSLANPSNIYVSNRILKTVQTTLERLAFSNPTARPKILGGANHIRSVYMRLYRERYGLWWLPGFPDTKVNGRLS